MEDFYREIYAVNGVTDVKFPENYPVSRLLGMVMETVDSLRIVLQLLQTVIVLGYFCSV